MTDDTIQQSQPSAGPASVEQADENRNASNSSDTMRIGLTHLAQAAVLRHMEANKRMHISSRCPTVKVYEQRIPLYVKSISFGELSIVLNGVSYSLGTLYLLFRERTGLVVVRDTRVLTDQPPLPFFLKFRTENLDLQRANLYAWTVRLDRSSFPLKSLTVFMPSIQELQYANLTHNLVIKCENHSREVANRVSRILTEQSFESVEIEGLGEEEGVLLEEVLTTWMRDGRPTETLVSFCTEKDWFKVEDMIFHLKRRYGGRAVYFKDGMGRREIIRHGSALSNNTTLETVLYCKNDSNGSQKVCIQTVPARLVHDYPFIVLDDIFNLLSIIVLGLWIIDTVVVTAPILYENWNMIVTVIGFSSFLYYLKYTPREEISARMIVSGVMSLRSLLFLIYEFLFVA